MGKGGGDMNRWVKGEGRVIGQNRGFKEGKFCKVVCVFFVVAGESVY